MELFKRVFIKLNSVSVGNFTFFDSMVISSSKKSSNKNFDLKKFFGNPNSKHEKRYSEDSLPLWIYLVAVIFLVVILFMFSKMI